MNQKLLEKVRAMNEAELYAAIYKDTLTGANNRRAFEEASYSTVAIIDLDSLKYLNDNYGHQTGDAYLCELVYVLRGVFGSDNVYRLAEGDEFAVTSSLKHDDLIDLLEFARSQFPGFTYGIGVNMTDADNELNKNKELRELDGERAARGECPPWEIKVAI